MLARLDALVGDWELSASIGGSEVTGGLTRFEWIENGDFLVQHADADVPPDAPAEWIANSPFPVTTIVGLDDARERFSMLYADARAVCRVYEMSLNDGVWKIWRNAPGFFQRFTGTFSDDGRTISAFWEMSDDGKTWRRDFALTYSKVG